MKIYDAMTLNRMLPRLKISGGGITRQARVKILGMRNKLQEVGRKADEYRDNTLEMCRGENDAQETVNATLNAYLNEETQIDYERLTPDEFEAVVELSTLELAEYEYLQTWMTSKTE